MICKHKSDSGDGLHTRNRAPTPLQLQTARVCHGACHVGSTQLSLSHTHRASPRLTPAFRLEESPSLSFTLSPPLSLALSLSFSPPLSPFLPLFLSLSLSLSFFLSCLALARSPCRARAPATRSSPPYYRVTSLIRNRSPLRPHSRTLFRATWWT